MDGGWWQFSLTFEKIFSYDGERATPRARGPGDTLHPPRQHGTPTTLHPLILANIGEISLNFP